MEQKQLDEIDESYFGEEFIDEEDSSSEVKVEDVKPKKKTIKKTAKKTVAKKVETAPEEKIEKMEEIVSKKEVVSEEPKAEAKAEEKPIESIAPSPAPKPTTPVNPWAEDGSSGSSEGSLFKEASTWKALTGIILVLLIFSVFTQGFNFSDDEVNGAGVGAGDDLPLEKAEVRALEYINEQLLQPPFLAELESSSQVGSLYRFTLLVGGQSIDSYMTKDGRFFFPQGFDLSVPRLIMDSPEDEVEGPEDDSAIVQAIEAVEAEIDDSEEVEVTEEEEESFEEVTEEEVVPVVARAAQELSLSSRKWSFTPDRLTVKRGDLVRLRVVSDTTQPSFSLPAFTFSIAQLGIEEEVSGSAVVEFTANQVGSFEFSCASCEDWRGMTGTLVVE